MVWECRTLISSHLIFVLIISKCKNQSSGWPILALLFLNGFLPLLQVFLPDLIQFSESLFLLIFSPLFLLHHDFSSVIYLSVRRQLAPASVATIPKPSKILLLFFHVIALISRVFMRAPSHSFGLQAYWLRIEYLAELLIAVYLASLLGGKFTVHWDGTILSIPFLWGIAATLFIFFVFQERLVLVLLLILVRQLLSCLFDGCWRLRLNGSSFLNCNVLLSSLILGRLLKLGRLSLIGRLLCLGSFSKLLLIFFLL